MATDALMRRLEESHALDPVGLPRFRTTLYVSFEDLLGDGSEVRLSRAIQARQRTAVVGTVGCGKSSLVEFVLATTPGLAPLWVTAAHEGDRTVTDPIEFARHMIRQIVRWAREAGAMSEHAQHRALVSSSQFDVRTSTISSTSVGVKLGKWIEPQFARQIQQTLADPETERSGGELIASLDGLVEFIDDVGLVPVVVVDDSDRWLSTSGDRREALIAGFFGDVARMLAERNWSVVLAVHPEYASATAFRAALGEGFINEQVSVPELPDPSTLRALVDTRIRRRIADVDEGLLAGGDTAVGPAGFDDIFEPGSEDVLFATYTRSDGNLRRVLTVASQAVGEAVRAGEAYVSPRALEEALLGLG